MFCFYFNAAILQTDKISASATLWSVRMQVFRQMKGRRCNKLQPLKIALLDKTVRKEELLVIYKEKRFSDTSKKKNVLFGLKS